MFLPLRNGVKGGWDGRERMKKDLIVELELLFVGTKKITNVIR